MKKIPFDSSLTTPETKEAHDKRLAMEKEAEEKYAKEYGPWLYRVSIQFKFGQSIPYKFWVVANSEKEARRKVKDIIGNANVDKHANSYFGITDDSNVEIKQKASAVKMKDGKWEINRFTMFVP
jgi:hypothetical protein